MRFGRLSSSEDHAANVFVGWCSWPSLATCHRSHVLLSRTCSVSEAAIDAAGRPVDPQTDPPPPCLYLRAKMNVPDQVSSATHWRLNSSSRTTDTSTAWTTPVTSALFNSQLWTALGCNWPVSAGAVHLLTYILKMSTHCRCLHLQYVILSHIVCPISFSIYSLLFTIR